jgi:hypothetical protein
MGEGGETIMENPTETQVSGVKRAAGGYSSSAKHVPVEVTQSTGKKDRKEKGR